MAEIKVIVEIAVPRAAPAAAAVEFVGAQMSGAGFRIDPTYQPVELRQPHATLQARLDASNEKAVVIRGAIEEAQTDALKRNPSVLAVWRDATIAPFCAYPVASAFDLELASETGPCPQAVCDCGSGPDGAKGTLAEVATYLGADQLWAAGYRGDGIVVAVCDTGVRRSAVGALLDGWSPQGATPWGDEYAVAHGTMCAVDVLGICPSARILDVGVLKSQGGMSGLMSDAIAAYDWVLERYRRDGTPQVVTNSWGIYQESWAPDYARNAEHPLCRKVMEAIEAGILVCFAAGNCGERCPSQRCGSDAGPGRSIWGVNGHPRVLTVGAANIRNEWIGYSSQGPAALDPRKPDLCAPSHFQGFTTNDNGTSAACPIAAGVLALLRQARPSLRQDEAKRVLQQSARRVGTQTWNAAAGAGIVQAAAAAAQLGILPVESAVPHYGLQFRGTVGAQSTARWVTVDWPTQWHVQFAVVPSTPSRGQGGAQLRWTVRSQLLAGPDRLTYWIDVTNVSMEEVSFEARYWIVST
jgi:subtilisin family serine protease